MGQVVGMARDSWTWSAFPSRSPVGSPSCLVAPTPDSIRAVIVKAIVAVFEGSPLIDVDANRLPLMVAFLVALFCVYLAFGCCTWWREPQSWLGISRGSRSLDMAGLMAQAGFTISVDIGWTNINET